MGRFHASLRTIGDRRGLPAVVTVADSQIKIEAGEQELGSWALDEVALEETEGSVYRLEVEGDRILIDFEDVVGFREMLASTSRMRSRTKVRGVRVKPAKTAPVKEAKAPKPSKAPKAPRATKEKAPRQAKKAAKESAGEPGGLGARVDKVLAHAEHRWGSLMPSWVFSRVMVLVLLILMVATVVVPGLVSLVLLIAGLLLVLFGAVVYTDTMLASRFLPGRMTPMHVLLFGVTVLMLGVLIGVVG